MRLPGKLPHHQGPRFCGEFTRTTQVYHSDGGCSPRKGSSATFINQVLAAYGSPARGKGQSLYDLGVQYGIDPAYALAFFLHESRFGTTGEARATLSLGNERCIQDRPCIDRQRGGYAQMQSWEDGFEHWYMLIRNLYIARWHRVTVAQIIPKYAPSSDGNNEAGYIAAVKHFVDTWRAGHVYP